MLFCCAGCQKEDNCEVCVARDCVLFKFKDGGSLCMDKERNLDCFIWKAASNYQCEDPEQYFHQPETVTMEIYKPDPVVEVHVGNSGWIIPTLLSKLAFFKYTVIRICTLFT